MFLTFLQSTVFCESSMLCMFKFITPHCCIMVLAVPHRVLSIYSIYPCILSTTFRNTNLISAKLPLRIVVRALMLQLAVVEALTSVCPYQHLAVFSWQFLLVFLIAAYFYVAFCINFTALFFMLLIFSFTVSSFYPIY